MTSRHAQGTWQPIVPPTPSTIDLHTHTRRSDGVLEPADLVRQAGDAGVRLLSITDHDNLGGYREAAAGVLPPDLELIPGVEINAVTDGGNRFWEGELHILGLGVDPHDEAFEATLAAQRGQRRRRFEQMLTRLRELGMPVDTEIGELAEGDEVALGRPTVARALVLRGHAATVEDAFRRWLGYGMPAWAPRAGLGPKDAIAAIRSAGGLPVLAHFGEAGDRRAVVRDLKDEGLAGLEVYYRAWDRATVESVGQVAREFELVPTGGSDYHGDLGPYAQAHAALWVPPEVEDQVRRAMADCARG